MTRLFFSLPFFLFAFFGFSVSSSVDQEMTLCGLEKSENLPSATSPGGKNVVGQQITFPLDPSLSYSMPMLSSLSQNLTLLTWTEKDEKGETALCMAKSDRKNLNFSDKKIIFKGPGVGNSRMMRAKILEKKDGKLVAIFSNREESPATEPGKRPKRSSNIVFCESVDRGNTWSAPRSVDTDPIKSVRGFFDAIVLPNDEIAVVYLKDVENSTKHEERNLRLALTKNGIFQPERIIDPVVCDCCPINTYLDKSGNLNVVYRDNNNDIRDMARMVSKDNALTFSNPEIVYKDNWKIAGCPHQGAISSQDQKNGYLVWFAGAETEKGFRLTTMAGKKLAVLDDASAKEPWLTSDASNTVFLWQQNKDDNNLASVAFRTIKNGVLSEMSWLVDSRMTMNVSGLLNYGQLITAREVMGENKKNTIDLKLIQL